MSQIQPNHTISTSSCLEKYVSQIHLYDNYSSLLQAEQDELHRKNVIRRVVGVFVGVALAVLIGCFAVYENRHRREAAVLKRSGTSELPETRNWWNF